MKNWFIRMFRRLGWNVSNSDILLKDIVGRTFKMWTSYSGESSDKGWWLYVKIIGVEFGKLASVKSFKNYVRGVNIEVVNSGYYYYPMPSCYAPISQEEYDRVITELREL